ncbi:hypothetical protein B0T13DRAFT_390900 [Neurospora crassa]|nr:hypothetical protein B0T13DRAFT_390900 [Neurospora crassa]
MAQDKQNRSKLRAKEAREVSQTSHASVPTSPSQGENVETPIANKKDTSGLGNDTPVPPGSSQQHHAVTAQQSQYLVSPGARSSNVSHLSPVNNLDTGIQHLFNLAHDNQHPVSNSLGNSNGHSHIDEAPHHHHHGEQNQRPIVDPLDGYAFDPNVAGVSYHYGAPNQVPHPNRHVSYPDPIRNVVGAPHDQQFAQPALNQPANPLQRVNYGNLPMASGLNQQAANDFQEVAIQHYAYAEEIQYMGSVQAPQVEVSHNPNYLYFQGVPVQQYQDLEQPQPMGILQGNAAAQPNSFAAVYPDNLSAAHSTGSQGIQPQQHQLSQQPQHMNMVQGIPFVHPNNSPATYHNNAPAAHQTGPQVVLPQQHQLPQQPQPMDMVEPIPAYDPLNLGIPQDQPYPITPGPPHPQANHPAVLALEDINPDQDINEIIDAAANVLHADHRQCQHKWVDEDDVEHQCAGHA